MKKLFLVIAMMGLIVSVALPSWSATYDWKMVSFMPPSGILNYEIKQFKSRLEKKSNGAVKFTIYEASLGKPPDHWDMCKNNMVQFAFTANMFHGRRVGVLMLPDLPFEFPDPKSAKLVLNAWQEAGLLKEVSDTFKIIWVNPTSPLTPSFGKKKVLKLEDWKGLKIRAPSPLQSQAVAALGASSVSMPSGDVYTAMSTGVIDGYVTAAIGIIDWKYYEVTDYTIRNPLCFGMFFFIMNKDVWNGLSADLQASIDQIGKEVADEEIVKTMNDLGPIWDNVASKVKEVYTVPESEMMRWREATKGVAEKYIKEKEAEGYPVREAYKIMKKVVADYMKK